MVVEQRARPWPALAALAVIATALSVATEAGAAAFDFNDTTWEGCAELLSIAQEELGTERVVVQSVLDWQELTPQDGVLVLHPLPVIDAEEATAFMRAGGRLAIADDYGRGERLLTHYRIFRRTLPSRPAVALRDKPALPIAEPAVDTDGSGAVGLHPTVALVDRVVLNHGSGLSHPDLTPILVVRSQASDPVAVAVAGQVEAGRLLALGDPSVFINLMLRYPGNRRFAEGVVRYLAAVDRPGSEHGRLFVFANEFEQRAGFGGVLPWRKTVDRRLTEIRDGLAAWRRDGLPAWLHTALAVVAALAVLWWAVGALVRLYRGRVPRFARSMPAVAQGGVAGRVAVLAAPTSPPALALLELRSALTEALAHHLERPVHTALAELVAEARREAPAPPTAATMSAVLASMRRAEVAVVSGASSRATHREVAAAARAVTQLLEACGAEYVRLPDDAGGRSTTGVGQGLRGRWGMSRWLAGQRGGG